MTAPKRDITAPKGLDDDAVDRTVRRPVAVGLENVGVTYGDTVALRECSFEVARGETVALLGPSGSGKSTALKAIAGFERVSSGTVTIDGRDVTHHSPARRGIGIVVQSYALFPHMTVAKNVAFGLKSRGAERSTIAPRVAEVLGTVGMTSFADRLPRQLSGGQQQRVAIARALATRPGVLLLDEPLSALDAGMRKDMLGELQRLRAELPDVAMVYVTHDQSEALALADRVAVMRDTRLEAIGTTSELFHRPPTRFTATFLGGADVLPSGALRTSRPLPDGEHVLAVRPWAWRFTRTAPSNGLRVRVEQEQWRGAVRHVQARVVETGEAIGVDVPVLVDAPRAAETLWVEADPADVMVVPV